MFGYLNPAQAGFSCQQRSEYQQFYCALCQALGSEFGASSRMALSYDATLLAIMMAGLEENQSGSGPPVTVGRCPMSMGQRKKIIDPTHTAFIFSASVMIEMVAGKILDNLQDEGGTFARILWKWIQPRHRKANNTLRSQGLNLEIELMTTRQAEAEYESKGLTEVASETSQLVGQIFAAAAKLGGREEASGPMYALGYYVGRVIYILDACDDLPQDQRKCAYNAINACYENACLQTRGRSSIAPRVKAEVADFVIQDLAHIRALVDRLDFGPRQELVRRLAATALSNQAMTIFGYSPEQKRSRHFYSPRQLLSDQSGNCDDVIGCCCICMACSCCLGAIQSVFESCSNCCGDEEPSPPVPPVEPNRPERVGTFNLPHNSRHQRSSVRQQGPGQPSYPGVSPNQPLYCSRCGSPSDLVYHPHKGWVCLGCAADNITLVEPTAINLDLIGKVCPYCQTTIKPGDRTTVCPRCKVPHHLECWQDNGNRCTTFGCR